mmetsp:Transcript_20814/g.37072  ORF Transcript_20814/g.37072 Transcript_20814/m.37072 type:complete len:226 (+) Transcript_20814:292-969(+)
MASCATLPFFLEKFPKLKTQLTATDKMCVNFGKRYKKITYCLNNATALGLALTVGSPVRTIRFLLKCGCSFDFEHFRKSPLHIAVSSKICPVETIECLFQSDLTTDASTPLGENGKTLLHHAVMANNSVEKLKVLINHKADLFSTDIQERTPLDCALVRSGSAKAREKVSTFLLDLYRKPMERDLASLHMLFPELYRAVFSGLKMEPKILEMLGATKIAKHKQDC